MTLPTITPVDPPVETTLNKCQLFDVADVTNYGRCVVIKDHGGEPCAIDRRGNIHYPWDATPVRIVARVQLGGAT